MPISENNGFTLIEAVIALAILTMGIMVVAIMQERSIRGNQSAFYRTSANILATSLLEELKSLPFDDPVLDQTSVNLENDGSAHTFDPDDFDDLAGLLALDNGQLVDNTNRRFTVSWAVADNSLPGLETPSKTIRLFMNWDSMLGNNRLEITAVKYNNISL